MSLKLTKAKKKLWFDLNLKLTATQRKAPQKEWSSGVPACFGLISHRHLKDLAATSVPRDSALVTLHNPKSRLSDLSSLTEKCHCEVWII